MRKANTLKKSPNKPANQDVPKKKRSLNYLYKSEKSLIECINDLKVEVENDRELERNGIKVETRQHKVKQR